MILRIAAAGAVCFALLSISGCGSETFGEAVQRYCNRFPSAVQGRCEDKLIRLGQPFLEHLEYREQGAAELEGIRIFQP